MKKIGKRKVFKISGIITAVYFATGFISLVLTTKAASSGIFFYIYFPIYLTIMATGWNGNNELTTYVALGIVFFIIWLFLFLLIKLVNSFIPQENAE